MLQPITKIMKEIPSRRANPAIVACVGLLFQVGMLQAQIPPSKGKWARARDVVTEEQLRKQVATAKTMADQLASQTKPVNAARPSTENKLYAQSIILFDGEKHTVIPMGAVLHLPPSLRSHVVDKATGDFTFWPNFLKRNESWLSTKEVTLKMAKGDPELARAVLKSVVKEPKLLVSVYKSCPISILEPAPPAEKDPNLAKTQQ